MKLMNCDQKQAVNFKVYKHTDTSRISPLFNADIQSENNHQLNLDSGEKYDILTTPLSICPRGIVTTEKRSSDEQITTWDNQKHFTNSSIYIAIT